MVCFFVWKNRSARSILKRFLALGFFFLLGMAACSPAVKQTSPTRTGEAVLIPYRTSTPAATMVASAEGKAAQPHTSAATIPPPPTPTPFTYEVKKGDTMLAIAINHGIKLEDLQAANPDVDPRIMSVGTRLVIPLNEQDGTQGVQPTPTPLPVEMKAPDCFPSADGGLWCVASVLNSQSQAVENLSAWINLFDSNGDVVTSTVAYPPLNLLPDGKTIPLLAFFPSSVLTGTLDSFVPQAELITAFPVAADGRRYLPLEVQVSQQMIAASGLQATVQGRVDYPQDASLPVATPTASTTVTPGVQTKTTPQPSPPAKTVWLAAVAYGQDGNIVGVRKWEAAKAIPPGKHRDFEITVYSLGPAIARVDVLLEARP